MAINRLKSSFTSGLAGILMTAGVLIPSQNVYAQHDGTLEHTIAEGARLNGNRAAARYLDMLGTQADEAADRAAKIKAAEIEAEAIKEAARISSGNNSDSSETTPVFVYDASDKIKTRYLCQGNRKILSLLVLNEDNEVITRGEEMEGTAGIYSSYTFSPNSFQPGTYTFLWKGAADNTLKEEKIKIRGNKVVREEEIQRKVVNEEKKEEISWKKTEDKSSTFIPKVTGYTPNGDRYIEISPGKSKVFPIDQEVKIEVWSGIYMIFPARERNNFKER